MKDIGRVELGAQTYSQTFKLERQAGGGHRAFSRLPDANALDSGEGGRAPRWRCSPRLPAGPAYTIPFDTTNSSRPRSRSLQDLVEAGVLVLIVILVFLQDWRAMLVPATTVPVTIIGAFAGHGGARLHGQPVDAVRHHLAIGIVVDDAIVIVEGVSQSHRGRDARPRCRRARRWTSCSGRSSASRWC